MSKIKSPITQLVLFMICLAIAGSLIAGMHYAVIDRPAQIAALQAPKNSDDCRLQYDDCFYRCNVEASSMLGITNYDCNTICPYNC